MLIREIKKSDNAFLAKIIRDTFIEHDAPQQGTVYSDPTTDFLFEYFQINKAICWIAELHDEVVGSCGIYPTEGLPSGNSELVKFYIKPSARGIGIGKTLINKCFESANEFGYSHIYLESLPMFSNAINLYNKLGFESLQNALGNSGHTSCNIWMTKKL